MTKDILIIGGSGILSMDFTELLIQMGNRVFVLNRGQRATIQGARAIIADWRSESVEELQRKIEGRTFDVVVDFLSFTPDHIKKSLEVVKRRTNQYVFISSATAYRNDQDQLITEKTPRSNSGWRYAMDKAECERVVADQNEVPYTIVRPYVTFGRTRLPFQVGSSQYWSVLQRIIHNDPIVLFEGGSATCTLTNTRDFARALNELLGNSASLGEAYHITSGMTATWLEVYEMVCEIVGTSPNVVSIEHNDLMKYLPEEFEEITADKGLSWRFDNSKLISVLGPEFKFETSIYEGLRESVRYLIENESAHRISWRWAGEIDGYLTSAVRGYKPRYLRDCHLTPMDMLKYKTMKSEKLRRTVQFVSRARKQSKDR